MSPSEVVNTVREPKDMTYKDTLRELGLLILKKRRLKNSYSLSSDTQLVEIEKTETDFSEKYRRKMRGNEQNLQQEKFLLVKREKNVTMSAIKYWKKIPREAVKSSTLEVFKT